MANKGFISVQTENIFPIIKQFLYSDHEIFLRELVSNAVDATTKLRLLADKGEMKGELGDLTIQVKVDKEAKTLTISDRGIGMTTEEVEKYLNQVAFSSAHEFLEKYKGEFNNIIGHFGLGFYSAFMVASKVEVVTRSWKDASAVKWSCDGNPEYQLEDASRDERGTDIVLHINADSEEFLEEHRISELLEKYCRFMPVPIQFGTKTTSRFEGEGEEEKEIKEETANIINNTDPIWKKHPNQLQDEDYKKFYEELYPYSPTPLFWIHLNIDYPFNLTGILYFPKLGNALEVQKNKIQLYSNQVFVTDNVKEIVPEFLTLLHGIIDSPDIPLNVSRSYLQADKNVKQITGYITKKVADKLSELFKKDRTDFESKWESIDVFVKYGMISEEKFFEKAIDFALLKNTENQFFTLKEYKEKIQEHQKDKHNKLVCIYANDPVAQDGLIQAARKRQYDVLVLNNIIDNHFIQSFEHKDGDVVFVRIDSETIDQLVQKDEKTESVMSEKEQELVKGLFQAHVGEGLTRVELKAMSPEDDPVMITRPEFMRRMMEMQRLQSTGDGPDFFADSYNVVVNTNHPLIAQKLVAEEAEAGKTLSRYLYQLALLNQGLLKGAELTAFIQRSIQNI